MKTRLRTRSKIVGDVRDRKSEAKSDRKAQIGDEFSNARANEAACELHECAPTGSLGSLTVISQKIC